MKTSVLISVLCDSINAVHEANDLVVHGDYVTDEKGHIAHTNDVVWTAKQTLQSAPTAVFKALWKELPENLRCERGDELCRQLYPHLHEESNYETMKPIVSELHSIVFKLWKEMHDAKDKFDF